MYVKIKTQEKFARIEDALCPYEGECTATRCAECRAFCREHPEEAMDYLDLRAVLDEE